jgi:hypothetical protein
VLGAGVLVCGGMSGSSPGGNHCDGIGSGGGVVGVVVLGAGLVVVALGVFGTSVSVVAEIVVCGSSVVAQPGDWRPPGGGAIGGGSTALIAVDVVERVVEVHPV